MEKQVIKVKINFEMWICNQRWYLSGSKIIEFQNQTPWGVTSENLKVQMALLTQISPNYMSVLDYCFRLALNRQVCMYGRSLCRKFSVMPKKLVLSTLETT